MGIIAICLGLTYYSVTLDLLTILLTGNNLILPFGLITIVNSISLAILIVISMYLGADLMMPEIKRYVVSIYLVLATIITLFRVLDPESSLIFIYPAKPSEDLIDYNVNISSPKA